jgi:hypothetical protein
VAHRQRRAEHMRRNRSSQRQQRDQEMEAAEHREMEASRQDNLEWRREQLRRNNKQHRKRQRRAQASTEQELRPQERETTQSPIPQNLSAVSPNNQFQQNDTPVPINPPLVNAFVQPGTIVVVHPIPPTPQQPPVLPPPPPPLPPPLPVSLAMNPPPPPPSPPPPHMLPSLHAILEGLGNGSIASICEIGIEIHQHPDMIASGRKFHDAMTKYREESSRVKSSRFA